MQLYDYAKLFARKKLATKKLSCAFSMLLLFLNSKITWKIIVAEKRGKIFFFCDECFNNCQAVRFACVDEENSGETYESLR
jgi:hypothetical protein